MPHQDIQFVANGAIPMASFVKIDTADSGADDYVLQCGAGDAPIGVSGVDTDRAPLSDMISTQYHAQQGEPCRVYQGGDVCLLAVGAAVTQGQRLKPNASGQGIPVTADGDFWGAVALESSSVAGSYLRVLVASPLQQVAGAPAGF